MSLIHVLMSHETWSNQFNFLSLCLFVSLYHHSFRWFFLSSFFLHSAHSYPFYSLPLFFKKLATASKRCIHIRNVFLFMLLIYSIILITFLAFYLISVICFCLLYVYAYMLFVRFIWLFGLLNFFLFVIISSISLHFFLFYLSSIRSIYLSVCFILFDECVRLCFFPFLTVQIGIVCVRANIGVAYLQM